MSNRFWPRFKLRTLLVALTAISLWLGWHAQRAQTEKAVVSRILEMGGAVAYDVDFDQRTYSPLADLNTSDDVSFAHRLALVRGSIPGNLFVRVFKVDLSNLSVTDEDLRRLDVLTGLRMVNLFNADVSDEAIQDFARRNPDVAVFHERRLTGLQYINRTVLGTMSGSRAEKAGLRKGDVIERINNQAVRSDPHLQYLGALYCSEDEVTLDVRRGANKLKLTLTLASQKD